MPITTKWKQDFRLMTRIERSLPGAQNKTARETANAIKTDIRSNWHHSSPAPTEGPPGIQSGTLDKSIFIDKADRTAKGIFAKKGEGYVYLTVDTEKAGSERFYGVAINDPDNVPWGNRPFFEPAFERAGFVIKGIAKEEFRKIMK
jgi:hypothetical protein